ncbi:MAG: hypothetical protein ACI82F_003797 [Planctomycetota bacterium]|jgi:hypothetical protein
MWDLIVDTAGALAFSILGWCYLRPREHDWFLQRWIQDFLVKNPGLFRSREGRRESD